MGCDEPAAVDTATARRSGMRRLRRSSPRAVQAWSGGLGTSVLSGPRGASARPDFEARAAVILDLYQGYYQGTPLQPGDRILSVDAKPSIQARGRCRPTAPAARGRPVRVEHECVRHGALALLAALDVRTGKVFAATPDTTGIVPFMDLIGQVMSRPEYKEAPRVCVIADNDSDHRGQAAAGRLRDAYPNAIMIHTPVHASWVNQVASFPSSRRKSSPPATSQAWAPSAMPCSPSCTATTAPPGRSTGSSPPTT
jgi:hypothetical protein